MTRATHTPGPWVASLAEWHNGAPWLIGAPVSECLPAEAERHIGNAYKEANARLIAAAPELLAAGCNLCAVYDDCDDDAMDSAIAAMRAVISKAKGK